MKINLVCRQAEPGRWLKLHLGSVLAGDWDVPCERQFEELDTFHALWDCLVLGKRWYETPFYRRIVSEIERGQVKWGCRTEAEFRRRLERDVVHLYRDIRVHGYRTQQQLDSKDLHNEVQVGIRRDGRLLFFNGRHRLAIARLLRLPQIPVAVAVRHEEWVAFKQRIIDYARHQPTRRIYQAIDHPDLRNIPANKGHERVEMLKAAVGDAEGTGRSLLDIGAHWGHMAQQFEKLGFSCVAIEANRENAWFAEKIRVATEANFTVWQGNAFDYPNPQADVVLALNVFHHSLKTEERYRRLVDFLQRLSAKTIFFEPHVPAQAWRQMAGAYRNYEPDEFAEFVAAHARMSRIELLGRADDGRPIYRLTKDVVRKSPRGR